MLSHFSCVQFFALPWTVPRLLCLWYFPGKSTGVGCHFLLQGIFMAQGLNPGLLHCRQTLYPLSHQGSPILAMLLYNSLNRLQVKGRNWNNKHNSFQRRTQLGKLGQEFLFHTDDKKRERMRASTSCDYRESNFLTVFFPLKTCVFTFFADH